MPITASILYDLMRCPHRVALDAFGDPALRDEANPFVRLLWERGTLYEREVIAKLKEPFLDLSGIEAREKEQQTLQAIARAEPLIYGGRLSADDLLGMPDLLRKVQGGYVPGDIKAAAAEEGAGEDSDGRPKLHYAIQLALYVDLLERHGASAGRRGFIWDIDGEEVPYDLTQPQNSTSTDTLWDEYQSALAGARAILARHTIPQAAYASVCKLCHWHTTCIDQLTQADDIERLFEPPRAVDLYFDVVHKATEWPTRDHGLKTLAANLGFDWRDKHPSGAASIEWFDRWARDRDPAVRQRILDYNEDDCRATRVLLDGIRALAASDYAESPRAIG